MPTRPAKTFSPRRSWKRRVLIVEGDPRVRSALGGLLAASEGFRVGGVAATSRDALAARDGLDVALVDVLLPELKDELRPSGRASPFNGVACEMLQDVMPEVG